MDLALTSSHLWAALADFNPQQQMRVVMFRDVLSEPKTGHKSV